MVAKTSPMGWNSWDCYGAAVDEKTVRANAEYMAKNLKSYGWEYIVVDIQWSEPTAENHRYHPFAELDMDEYSRLIPSPKRFPSATVEAGFTPLGDYIHSLGLKFGIHIMRGVPRQAVHRNTKILGSEKTARQIAATNSICYWNTDMYGVDTSAEGAQEYYNSLFLLYAEWGVDFVKVDDICNHYPHSEIEMINKAIKNCGREMVLSLSPGPAPIEQAEHLKQFANMWRITDDFWDKWELLYDMFSRAEKWCVHSGAGHWPDADMLPVGAILQDYSPANRTSFTHDEQYTMLTLWCIIRSPLMIGGDMVKNDEFTLSLITNEKILDMCRQSRSAHQLFRRKVEGNEIIVWSAFCHNGGKYLAVFNAGESSTKVEIDLEECEIENADRITELWTDKQYAAKNNKLICNISSHGVMAFKII